MSSHIDTVGHRLLISMIDYHATETPGKVYASIVKNSLTLKPEYLYSQPHLLPYKATNHQITIDIKCAQPYLMEIIQHGKAVF